MWWVGAIIVVVVIAGLVVYAIVHSRGLSISELVNNPTKYNGKEVTVEGDLYRFEHIL